MKQTGTASVWDTSRGFEDTQVECWAKFIQLQDLQCQCKVEFCPVVVKFVREMAKSILRHPTVQETVYNWNLGEYC